MNEGDGAATLSDSGALSFADLVLGAVAVRSERAPVLVTREMLRLMKRFRLTTRINRHLFWGYYAILKIADLFQRRADTLPCREDDVRPLHKVYV